MGVLNLSRVYSSALLIIATNPTKYLSNSLQTIKNMRTNERTEKAGSQSEVVNTREKDGSFDFSIGFGDRY